MSKIGYVCISRKQFRGGDMLWDDGTPFDSRSAWTWLIQCAAFADTTYQTRFAADLIQRGEFVASLRFLADRWGWSKNTVSRYLKMLTKVGRIVERRKGQHGTVYFLVNYEKYNGLTIVHGTPEGTDGGAKKGQKRDKEEEGKEGKEGKEVTTSEKSLILFRMPCESGQLFDISITRIETWQSAYPTLDVSGEIPRMIAWCEANPTRLKKFRGIPRFVVNWLNTQLREQRGRGVLPLQKPQDTTPRGPDGLRIATPQEDVFVPPTVVPAWRAPLGLRHG